jgi:hypothetical protein
MTGPGPTLRILHTHGAFKSTQGPMKSSMNLTKSLHGLGLRLRFYAPRVMADMAGTPVTTAVPRPLQRLHVNRLEPWLRTRIQRMFLRDLRPVDVA